MKSRSGFVSNSSSSSFVVIVSEMTQEQKDEFKKQVDEINWEEICCEYGQPYFSTSKKVFGGRCDYEAYDVVRTILANMNLTNLLEDLD